MVHFTDTVVTLKDLATGKPFREFDHSRSGNISSVTVRMPFDSEYGITLKTMDHGRRRVEVDIDGTKVADLIFNGGPGFQETLERFMDSDKRFKFVKADNPAVADPSNPRNGDVIVRVWREYVPYVLNTVPPTPGNQWHGELHRPRFFGGVLRGSSKGCAPEPTGGLPGVPICAGGATVEGSAPTMSFMADSVPCSCTVGSSMTYTASHASVSDRGATVEGNKSGQTFGTTHWNGDFGDPSVFVFRLRAPQPVTKITAIYCQQCGFAAGPEARFCAACGAKLAQFHIVP